jgi:hypothetical protein
VQFSNSNVKMSHSKVDHYVKIDIAMSHLTCLGEILTELCQKVTYSWRKMAELCPNDRIMLTDGVTQFSFHPSLVLKKTVSQKSRHTRNCLTLV